MSLFFSHVPFEMLVDHSDRDDWYVQYGWSSGDEPWTRDFNLGLKYLLYIDRGKAIGMDQIA